MKGQRQTPPALKLLHDRPERRRTRDREPWIKPLDESVPPELTDPRAVEEWKRIAPHLSRSGHCVDTDRPLVASYCLLWARWLELQAAARAAPPVVERSRGPAQSHLIRMADRAYGLLLKVTEQLGLSPVSRGRVAAIPPDNRPHDEFAAWQRQRPKR